ncbi:MAG: VWA domain-containing protein [Deltaproteobacteria bacterium]|nr:VWA domain-containing protein [Deltaproteobacteria bacterium]
MCTDDPQQQNFPVKVLFVMDSSQVTVLPQNDQAGSRIQALEASLTRVKGRRNYSFGVISFAGRAFNQLQGDAFTRDASRLTAAFKATAAPMPCETGRCRNVVGALDMASALITGDVLANDPGEVSRTSYVVVLFTTGGPAPAIDRCACRDVEAEAVYWSGCPWVECDQDLGSPARCAAPSLDSSQCADTSTHWVLPDEPQNPTIGLTSLPVGCAACDFCCVYPVGGRSGSCEERLLTARIRNLRAFALENGAAQFQFHATYLPDSSDGAFTSASPLRPLPCTCADGSDCSRAADWERSTRLLVQMAHAGGGSFQSFFDPATKQALPVDFSGVNFFDSGEPLLYKELMVSNVNALATYQRMEADSDQDGLSDRNETELGLCAVNPDTDGDGVGDAVEIHVARSPMQAEEALECIDIPSRHVTIEDLCATSGTTIVHRIYQDHDADGLNSCEERLLGTNDSLFDSDGDGIGDKSEFVAGSNHRANDLQGDDDFDGILNRDEIRSHTDLRSNDSQDQLDRAYRYEHIDEGIKEVLSVSAPTAITGVRILGASASSKGGLGTLRFDPGIEGDPSQPPTLAWHDPGDQSSGTTFGPKVAILTPRQEGYKLPSYRPERFLRVFVEGIANYPSKPQTDRILITTARRNCVRFRVRNITLVETQRAFAMYPDGPFMTRAGDNEIRVFFAEAPQRSHNNYGIFRQGSTIVNYRVGPPAVREPKVAEVYFQDTDLVLRR